MCSLSSRDATNGGTVSICVESVTAGRPHSAYTLNRSGETSIASAVPPVGAARPERYRSRYSPTCFSFSVIDSMSISARVISNGCIGFRSTGFSLCSLGVSVADGHRLKPVLPGKVIFLMRVQSKEGTARRGEARRREQFAAPRFSIALHPIPPDDSGRVLDALPSLG